MGEIMISVMILINGNPIIGRSAVNSGDQISDGSHVYKVDDGSIIHHQRDRGAVELAIKMLKTIKD
jgi:hypothetical protein